MPDKAKQHKHKAVRHPKRARQFVPFAALRGFDELLREREEKLLNEIAKNESEPDKPPA